MILDKGLCVACGKDCKVSGTNGCQECYPRFGLDNFKCFPCSESCLTCNRLGCLLCEPNKALDEAKCKIAFLINYQLEQFYDPISPETFNLRVTLETHDGISHQTFKEFQKSILDYQEKFSVTIPSIENGVKIQVEKEGEVDMNKYVMRVTPVDTSGLSVGDKLNLTISSFSKSLDPKRTGIPFLYTLLQKSQTLEVEVLKLIPKKLNERTRSLAKISRRTNQISMTTSLGLGVLLNMASTDSEGAILLFNQFLTLVKRLKFIGIYFGEYLQEYIEIICGETPRSEKVNSERLRRVLEVSLKEDNKGKIREYSKGTYSKLDTYNRNIFFEGVFMIKSLIYILSWAMKLVGNYLLKSMKNKSSKIVEWKLKYLLYQRKAHFSVTMMCTMDILFTGGGILLHRKSDTISVIIKLLCCVNFTLMLIDLSEIFNITASLKFEKEEKENGEFEENKRIRKNIQRPKIADKRNPRSENTNFEIKKIEKTQQKHSSKFGIHPTPGSMRSRRARNNKSKLESYTPRRIIKPPFRDPPNLNKSMQKDKDKPKLFIDSMKTLEYNSRNMAVEDFTRAYINKTDPGSFSRPIYLLNNLLSILHLAALQISIISLPKAPIVLIAILVAAEITFIGLNVIPYFYFRFISLRQLTSKMITSICLLAFYLICLYIAFENPKKVMPVNDRAQQFGIVIISLGIMSNYLFTFFKVVGIVVQTFKKYCSGAKNKTQSTGGIEDLTKARRGLIFYTNLEKSTENKKINPKSPKTPLPSPEEDSINREFFKSEKIFFFDDQDQHELRHKFQRKADLTNNQKKFQHEEQRESLIKR